MLCTLACVRAPALRGTQVVSSHTRNTHLSFKMYVTVRMFGAYRRRRPPKENVYIYLYCCSRGSDRAVRLLSNKRRNAHTHARRLPQLVCRCVSLVHARIAATFASACLPDNELACAHSGASFIYSPDSGQRETAHTQTHARPPIDYAHKYIFD